MIDLSHYRHTSWAITACASAIVALGLAFIYSASLGMGEGAGSAYVARQAAWAAIGLASAALLAATDYRRLASSAYLLYGVCILVLVLLVAKDSEILRVEEAILEEDESGQVRTISTSALLALTKMAREYRLTHGDVLLLLLASAPSVDPIIDLLARVVSRCEAETPTLEEIAQILGPSGRGGEAGPGEALQDLIDQSRYYAFGSRGAGRRETRR